MKRWLILLLACFVTIAAAKVVQEDDSLAVTVTDAYGRPRDAVVRLTHVHDDEISVPKPVLVLNHGRSAKAEVRASTSPARSYAANARWFAQAGFWVVIPTRMGYGATGGEDVEDTGGCSRKRYAPGYEAAVSQTLQILDHVRKRPQVMSERTLIMGQSFGGATAIALAAKNPLHVQAFVNFAGGGGGNPETMPMNPCDPGQLMKMFASYGKSAKGPTLWIYTENDQYFGPLLPRSWYEAYSEAGGLGEFVLYPANGRDGHSLFTAAPGVWRSRVTQFLEKNGFADMKWPGSTKSPDVTNLKSGNLMQSQGVQE